MILVTSKQRLLQYLDFKGIEPKKFYEKTGIRRGLIDKDKLKATINDTSLAKIVAKYPDLNLYWLLSGDGNMLNSSPVQGTESIALQNKLIALLEEQNAELKCKLEEAKAQIVQLNKSALVNAPELKGNALKDQQQEILKDLKAESTGRRTKVELSKQKG